MTYLTRKLAFSLAKANLDHIPSFLNPHAIYSSTMEQSSCFNRVCLEQICYTSQLSTSLVGSRSRFLVSDFGQGERRTSSLASRSRGRDADLQRAFPACKLYLTCMVALPLLPDQSQIFGQDQKARHSCPELVEVQTTIDNRAPNNATAELLFLGRNPGTPRDLFVHPCLR
jgi:hypothetical protein